MRAFGLVVILLCASLLAPVAYAAVFHDSAQIQGGTLGSDFGVQDFVVNGTFDVTGDVGIGTTNPQERLTVDVGGSSVGGGIGIYGGFGETERYINLGYQTVPTVRLIGYGRNTQASGQYFAVEITNGSSSTNLTEWFRITDAGRVGIGTQSPAATLDVDGNLSLLSGFVVDTFSGDSALGGGSAANSTVPTQWAVKSYVDSQISGGATGWTDGGTTVSLSTSSDNVDVNTLYVDNTAGEVGVGTSSPNATLHVVADGQQLLIEPAASVGVDAIAELRGHRNGATSIDQVQLILSNYDDDLSATNTLGMIAGVVTDAGSNVGDIVLYSYSDGSTKSESMRITRNGVVRVGNSGSPGSATSNGDLFVEDALEVDGSIDLSGQSITGFATATDLGGGSASNSNLPTQLAVKSYVDAQVGGSGSMSGFTLAGDSGTSAINDSDTLDVAGGTSVTTSVFGDTVTVDVTDDSIDGSELADTITLDATLNVNGQDVNFDSNTLFVDVSTNRVGIGTPAPSDVFHVNGSLTQSTGGGITIERSASSGDLKLGINGTYAWIQSHNGNPLAINELGNGVGIGVNNPAGKLQVVGDEVRIGNAGSPGVATADGDLFVEDALEVDGSIDLSGQSVTGFATATDLGGGSASNSNLPTQLAVKSYVDAQVGSSGSMSGFTLAGDSGTSAINDSDTLDVAGGTSVTTSVSGDTVTVDVADDSIDGSELADTITLDSTLAVTTGSNDVNFDSDTLFVDGSADRVGIGGTNPSANLDVRGASEAEGDVLIDNYEIKLLNSGQAHWSIFNNESTGDFYIADTSSSASPGTLGTNRLVIDHTTGGVGIGLDAPAGRLQVTGDEVRIGSGTPGVATSGGDLYVLDALEVDGSIDLSGQSITGFATATDLGGGSASNSNLPTQLAVKSYVDAQVGGSGSMSGFTLAGDSGTSAINDSDTLDVAGGTSITTSVSGDTVTVGVTADSIGGTELADTITLDSALEISSTLNADSFTFRSGSSTTAERDVFTIIDEDSGGGSQDESSSFKVYRTGAFDSLDDGSSLVELTYTGVTATDNRQFYILGRTTDEGAVNWGIDMADSDIFTSGGLFVGATGTDCGGTGADCFNGGTFNVSAAGNAVVGGDLTLATGATITEFSIDDTLAGNSDSAVPTEQAVKAYVDDRLGGVTTGAGTATQLAYFNESDTLTSDANLWWDPGSNELGIRTSSPGYALDVNGTIRSASSNSILIRGTDGNGPRIDFGTSSDPDGYLAIGAYDSINNINTTNRDFKIYSDAAADAFFIEESNGRVGIGTATPDYTLDLVDDGDIGGLDQLVGFNDLRLFGDSTGGPDIYISAGGQVGIGTASTAGQLIVVGDEVRIGDAGTPGVATADGDLYVEDALEVDGSIDLTGTSVTGFATATDLGAGASSNSNLPTQLAVKTYVDNAVTGMGDVSGPASSTDNAIARFDSTTGKIIQNSGVTIDDSNNIAGVGTLSASGTITAATINTGPGATEVYAMNQDVQTSDDVTFRSVSVTDFGTPGSQNLVIGDDAYFSDVDSFDTIGLYGLNDANKGNLKLGATGPTVYGDSDGNLGVGVSDPSSELDVAGDIEVSGRLNQTADGVVQEFSNGCTMTANTSGLYWNC